MCFRSRLARAASSTRYVMLRADLVEHRLGRPDSAVTEIVKSLANALTSAVLGCEIEQTLIGFGILHDRRRLAVHRQDDRTFGLLEMAQNIGRTIAESGHRLNVFSDVHR